MAKITSSGFHARSLIICYFTKMRLEISTPFTWDWSKNKMWKATRFGRLYLNPKTKQLIDFLIYQIRIEMRKNKIIFFKKKKVYLSIYAEIENHRGDALNLLDTIADAVKEGIGIDDRWFAIKLLDWEIKKDGKINIEIFQQSP